MRKLRYILNFARLADFEPGAAGPTGSRGRGDVSVGAEIAPWRARVADALHGPLREERDPATALSSRPRCSRRSDRRPGRAAPTADRAARQRLLRRRTGRRGRLQEAGHRVGRWRRGGLRLHRRHAATARGRPGTGLHDRRIVRLDHGQRGRPRPAGADRGVRRVGQNRVLRGDPRARAASPQTRVGRPVLAALRSVRPGTVQSRGRRTNADVGLGDSVRRRGRRCAQTAVFGAAVEVPPPGTGGAADAFASVPPDRHRPAGRGATVAGVGVHRSTGRQTDRHR